MQLIKPKQQDAVLLNDILSFESDTAFKVWWLAQSGFLIKWQGKYLLFDPYLSDSLSLKYKDTEKPHVRMSELAIDPAALQFVDIVTSSHNHTDHLDADTLKPILRNNSDVKLVIPEANREFVANRVGCQENFPTGLNEGWTIEHKGFKITGLPAAHNTVERDEKGQCKFMGFVVQLGKYAVYHSGDTLWFDGLDKLLKPFAIDIAFLPINGNKPERKVAGNLNAEEAALLGKAMDARLVIPHHYHLFHFNTEDPMLFEKHCREHSVKYKVLRIGEGFIYPAG
jgi:L-ascorbate metabolism protein UlaG (beta-lactamase superfamily)